MDKKNGYILQPDYFGEFHCLADECHNDCCHGWRINIPRQCYMKIRSARKSAELEELVSKGVRRNKKEENNSFFAEMQLNEKGDCVFLNERRLCRLQLECGPAALPHICQDFPRRLLRCGEIILRSCTPACEGVVNLLWKRKNGLEFEAVPREKGIVRIGKVSVPEDQQTLFSHFEEIQWMCISILQNRAYTLDERMILLGMALRALSGIQSTTEDEAVKDWLARYAALTKGDGFKETVEKLPSNPSIFLASNLETLFEIFVQPSSGTTEYLRRRFALLGLKLEDGRFTYHPDVYFEQKERLNEFLHGQEYLTENVLVNEAFSRAMPFSGGNGVWDSYMRLCLLYSLLKFLLATSAGSEFTREDLVQAVVLWARILLHADSRVKFLVNRMHETESDTLAHMAVLING